MNSNLHMIFAARRGDLDAIKDEDSKESKNGIGACLMPQL